jgi:hypothetical protein
VDLVQFITGLKPVEVSVKGIQGKFPNGNQGYLWSTGRVLYENGAILTVTNGLGYPDDAAGSNEQCLSMYFEGKDCTGHLKHNDQFRGVEYAFITPSATSGKKFQYVNPDYFRFVPWEGEGEGAKPVGYGYDSIAAIVSTIHQIENEICSTSNLPSQSALQIRQRYILATDRKDIIATPANSFSNELVMEAARFSITHNGQPVKILYGANPHIEFAP